MRSRGWGGFVFGQGSCSPCPARMGSQSALAVLCLSARTPVRAYLAVHREAVVLIICHGIENAGYSGQTEDISDSAETYRKTRKDIEQDTSMMRNCCQDSNIATGL